MIGIARVTRNEAWLVLTAAILPYLNAFSATFQFDDRRVVIDDRRLSSAAAFVDHLPGMIRPVLKLTFLIDRHLFGLDPAGYHALNVALHAGSALLVWAILRRVTRAWEADAISRGLEPDRGGAARSWRWLPLGVATLFAVHPLATETVTYIAGRASGLSSFLVLLSMWLGMRALEPALSRPRFVARAWGCACVFVLALFSKETAVAGPVLLALIHGLTPRTRAEDRRRPAAIQAACWLAAGTVACWALWHPRYVSLLRASLDTRTVASNLLTSANAAVVALGLVFAPWRLNFDHDIRVVRSLVEWPTPLSIAVLGALVAVAALARRRHPATSLGIGWFLVAMLPAHSALARFDVLSERNLYLPSVGVFITLVGLALDVTARAGRGRPRGWRVAVVGFAWVIASLGGATFARNRVYASELTLWGDTVAKSPLKSRPHENLGYALRNAGDLDAALREYRRALELDPDNVLARQNLMEAWLEKRRREGAPEWTVQPDPLR